jgi:hypothetical protein
MAQTNATAARRLSQSHRCPESHRCPVAAPAAAAKLPPPQIRPHDLRPKQRTSAGDRRLAPAPPRPVRRSNPAILASSRSAWCRYATALRSRRSLTRRSRSAATSAARNCQRPPASRCPRRAPVLASRRTMRVETPRTPATSEVPRKGGASEAVEAPPFCSGEEKPSRFDGACEFGPAPGAVPEAEPPSCSIRQFAPTRTSAPTARRMSSRRLGGTRDRASRRSIPPG